MRASWAAVVLFGGACEAGVERLGTPELRSDGGTALRCAPAVGERMPVPAGFVPVQIAPAGTDTLLLWHERAGGGAWLTCLGLLGASGEVRGSGLVAETVAQPSLHMAWSGEEVGVAVALHQVRLHRLSSSGAPRAGPVIVSDRGREPQIAWNPIDREWAVAFNRDLEPGGARVEMVRVAAAGPVIEESRRPIAEMVPRGRGFVGPATNLLEWTGEGFATLYLGADELLLDLLDREGALRTRAPISRVAAPVTLTGLAADGTELGVAWNVAERAAYLAEVDAFGRLGEVLTLAASDHPDASPTVAYAAGARGHLVVQRDPEGFLRFTVLARGLHAEQARFDLGPARVAVAAAGDRFVALVREDGRLALRSIPP